MVELVDTMVLETIAEMRGGSNPSLGTVYVAQFVRALDCDSRGRRFKSDHTP